MQLGKRQTWNLDIIYWNCVPFDLSVLRLGIVSNSNVHNRESKEVLKYNFAKSLKNDLKSDARESILSHFKKKRHTVTYLKFHLNIDIYGF